MIIPIRAIGDPVLKRQAKTIDKKSKELDSLIDDMFATMYNANGVGLAAPQIGESIKLFVVDTGNPEEEDEKRIKEVFINPEIVEFFGEDEPFEEGCLSIPNIREDIIRPEGIVVKYHDQNFKLHEKEIDGMLARVFQHEFDHLEGVLFTDLVSPLKKRMLKAKLEKISKGKIKISYPMKFPK